MEGIEKILDEFCLEPLDYAVVVEKEHAQAVNPFDTKSAVLTGVVSVEVVDHIPVFWDDIEDLFNIDTLEKVVSLSPVQLEHVNRAGNIPVFDFIKRLIKERVMRPFSVAWVESAEPLSVTLSHLSSIWDDDREVYITSLSFTCTALCEVDEKVYRSFKEREAMMRQASVKAKAKELIH